MDTQRDTRCKTLKDKETDAEDAEGEKKEKEKRKRTEKKRRPFMGGEATTATIPKPVEANGSTINGQERKKPE